MLEIRGFRAVYREHYGFVWAVVRRLGVPTALVDDALQDTFVVAYRRREEFAGESIRPWLYGIARGIASNYRRSAQRSARKHRAIAQASTRSTRSAESQVVLHDLDRFLGDLSARDRELFVLSEVEGFTGPELASALGCKMSTAYGRVRSLRQRFAEQGDAGGLRRSRQQRPRARAGAWVGFVHAVSAKPAGWLGLGAAASNLVAAGVGATTAGLVIAGVIAVRGPAEPTASAPTEHVEPAVAARDRPEPARDSSPADEAPPSPPSEPEVVPAKVAVQTPAPSSPSQVRSDRPVTTELSPPLAPDALAEENALLRGAATALSEEAPDRALAAMRTHAQRFPGSALSDLRTALRIEALCALGNEAQARGEAAAYEAAHPQSPTLQRIRHACPAQTASSGQSEG